jgi:hypothetical protein
MIYYMVTTVVVEKSERYSRNDATENDVKPKVQTHERSRVTYASMVNNGKNPNGENQEEGGRIIQNNTHCFE